MNRFVFYGPRALDSKGLTAAKNTAMSLGVTVVSALAGTMLKRRRSSAPSST